ncbi:MAG: N-acetyltransferase family protein [Pseudomonadota bacterium]
MTLRDATAADAPAIADLLNGFIRETTISFSTRERTPDEIVQDIASRQQAGLPWIVLQGRQGLAGYATAAPFRRGEGYAKTLEHSLFVAPDLQRKGAGRALFDELETRLEAQGAMSMVAGISAENAPALRFHRQVGFSEVGRVERAGMKFGRAIDLLLMQKHLSPSSSNG